VSGDITDEEYQAIVFEDTVRFLCFHLSPRQKRVLVAYADRFHVRYGGLCDGTKVSRATMRALYETGALHTGLEEINLITDEGLEAARRLVRDEPELVE